ncbi:hypothetical protein HMPREF9057_00990 [Actinomyces sp. oral taxon 171 str. F0337]|nr:hypothetical protein HMPREF9057_00990 [Actinomyces sp. oral taxon 171 str. F0337]
MVLTCDGGHIRVSRISENLSFSHHPFHRNHLMIVSVSMRGPGAGGLSSPGAGPLKAPAAPAVAASVGRWRG